MSGRNLFALVSLVEIWELLPICQGHAGDKPKVRTQQQATTPLDLASANNISCHCCMPVIWVKETFFCILSTTICTNFFRPRVQQVSYAEGNWAQVSFSVSAELCIFPAQRNENLDAISASSWLVATRILPITFPRGEKSCLHF